MRNVACGTPRASRLLLALGSHASHPRKDVWEGTDAALSLRCRLHGNVLACVLIVNLLARRTTQAQPAQSLFKLFSI